MSKKTEDAVFKRMYTLQHVSVTVKIAHMNGYWKDYDFKIHVFRVNILSILIELHMQMITVGNRWYYELSIGVSYVL